MSFRGSGTQECSLGKFPSCSGPLAVVGCISINALLSTKNHSSWEFMFSERWWTIRRAREEKHYFTLPTWMSNEQHKLFIRALSNSIRSIHILNRTYPPRSRLERQDESFGTRYTANDELQLILRFEWEDHTIKGTRTSRCPTHQSSELKAYD